MEKTEKERRVYPLRPHHGMCLAFFKGEGYSDSFTKNMAHMLNLFMDDSPVRLCLCADEICKECPNRRPAATDAGTENSGESAYVCVSEGVIAGYDRSVLGACSLKEGEILNFRLFASKVQENIIERGLRGEICGGCCWRNICDNTKSRWQELPDGRRPPERTS